ncbi:metallophosphoesterase [Actinoplanes sp. GCM10030250]|uniref:metallophosphoesterase n=1 Tax=Actinoplanes sp. GCM10030250 TaxID=3273376 RepID=UPI00361B5050
MPPLFVVSDIHGHRHEWWTTLSDAGLIDASGDWSGGDARLWLLGDYVDRGPDGIGVIDDIRRLTAQAPATGGQVGALLGNHEALLLAVHRFGTTPVPGWESYYGAEPRWESFEGAWQRWGGRPTDLERLTPDHVAWLTGLPAMALVDGHLLMHSDTTEYLAFGSDVASVNATVERHLAASDPIEFLHFWGRLSSRGSFHAAGAAAKILATFGAETLVHGHSTLMTQFRVPLDLAKTAFRYADGRAIAVDGGVFEGGQILLTRLPVQPLL